MHVFQSFTYEEVQGFKFGYQPIGKPAMYSHIYFVDGLLIDTGHRMVRKKVSECLQKLPIEQVFITHHHEDHSGNIEEVKKLTPKPPVYASEACCKLMKKPPKLSFAQKITWGDRPAQPDLTPRYDSIETPRFSFRMIPIPGHASDMYALYEPTQKWLFSADLYINTYIDYFIDNESMTYQIDSIRRVLQLDFEPMFCGHKPQLNNGKQKLEQKLQFLEAFFEQVAAEYAQGYGAEEIFKRLKLKENWPVRLLSGGKLSKLNMVRAVVQALEKK